MSNESLIRSLIASLPEIIVLASATLLLLLELCLKRHQATIIACLSIVTVLVAAAATLMLSGKIHPGYSGLFVADDFSAFFKMIFYLVTVLCILFSIDYLKVEAAERGEYYILMLFALGGMMIVVSCTDLISLFVGLELMALAIYVLTAFFRRQIRSNEAAIKYLILGALSSCLLLYGISLFYGLSGTTQLAGLAVALNGESPVDTAVVLATLFLLAGLAFKVAAVPFHMWAPDVYEGAPTTITAFLSVAPKAAGFAVLLRIFGEALLPIAEIWWEILVVMSIATLAIGSVIALVQTNIKRMLAYSSINHAGFVLLGVVAGGSDGIASVMLYLLIYSFMNLGIFSVVIMMRKGSCSGEQIEDYAGLSKDHPAVALLMLLFLLALAGIPPTSGFFAKFYIFMVLIEQQLIVPAILAALFSVIAAFYYLRIVMLIYMKDPVRDFDLSQPLALRLVLAITAVATLGIGIFPAWFLELAQGALGTP